MSINSRLIVEKLSEAMSNLAEVIPKVRREDISIYINAGEWGLALEFICEFLYEYELPITAKAYRLLEEAEGLMNAKLDLLDALKSQIED